MKTTRILLLSLIALAIVLFYVFDLQQYLDLAYLKQTRTQIEAWRVDYPWQSAGIFVLVYIAVTALSLPGAAVMTLAGGAVFGLLQGTLLVSISSTTGATLAFLASRFLFRDAVQQRFARRLEAVNRGVREDGALYLFTLRLVPVFPFFIINIVMALTPMRTLTFFFVSMLGMLPGTLVYVNAGTQLAQIRALGDILSPELIGSFVLLGVFPLLAKKGVHLLRARLHKPSTLPGENDDPTA
jgi:uncharacterized membrane protein YdjX (TVP38/TMEM64 family)